MIDESKDLHPFAIADLEVVRVGAAALGVLTIRNQSETDRLELVRYGLPIGGRLENDVFVVESPRGIATFKGRRSKRRAPEEDDYLFIAPNRGARWEIDLTAHYEWNIQEPVTMSYRAFHPTLTQPLRVWRIQSNDARLT